MIDLLLSGVLAARVTYVMPEKGCDKANYLCQQIASSCKPIEGKKNKWDCPKYDAGGQGWEKGNEGAKFN
eukprot:g9036.t1